MELLTLLKYIGIAYLVVGGVAVLIGRVSWIILGIAYGEDYWEYSDDWYEYISKKKYQRSTSKLIRFTGAMYDYSEVLLLKIFASLPKVVGGFSSVALLWVLWKLLKA